jgi:hypothetical protein
MDGEQRAEPAADADGSTMHRSVCAAVRTELVLRQRNRQRVREALEIRGVDHCRFGAIQVQDLFVGRVVRSCYIPVQHASKAFWVPARGRPTAPHSSFPARWTTQLLALRG